jgi:hypothetical protein
MKTRIAILTVIAMGVMGASGAHAQTANNVGNGNAGFQNGNFNSNGNGGTGGQGGVGGTSVGNQNNIRYRVPGAIGIPGLAASQACLGSWSLGGSFYGGGFGVGKTYLERACESRALADQLYRYGLRQQAIDVIWSNNPLIASTTFTHAQRVVYRGKAQRARASGNCHIVQATASTMKKVCS